MDFKADPGDSDRALSDRLWEAPGMNIGFNSKINPDTCAHTHTLTVSSAGLERAICETCGHVSLAFMTDMVGDVRRSAFAREADERTISVSQPDMRVRYLATASA